MEHNQEEKVKEEEKKENCVKVPKNCKENRYYYRHREEILEKKRLARLTKKGIDVTIIEDAQLSLEERRKKKMEFLGLVDDSKIAPCVSSGV